jgi:site-specific recombinase XerD
VEIQFIAGVAMVNRNNYQVVKEYLKYLDSVQQLEARSIGRYRFYLNYLLIWADESLFSAAAEIHPTFAVYLATTRLDGASRQLAPSTLKKVIQTAKRFFLWLKMTYPREYRDLSPAWIDSLRPPRGAQTDVEHEYITLEEVQRLADLKLADDDLALQRDQAAAILLFLSGMRVGAFSTLPIGAVDLPNHTIKQWPSLGVETKNDKSALTYLLDIPGLLTVVERWDTFIRTQLPPTAMWYTPTISQWGVQTLSAEAPGSNRAIAVTKRVRKLFKLAGLAYKSPHKFRHGHAVYSLQRAKTMADYKAVSMNLMHEDIRVTDSIYAPLASHEVQQRIAGLTASARPIAAADNDMAAFVRTLSPEQLSETLMAIAQQLAR